MPQIVAHNYEIGYSFTHVYLWYDDDDRNAAALLEKGATIYILLRLQGTFD